MRILGIDPGLASTGIAVIEHREGDTWRLLESRSVRTASTTALPDRLRALHDAVAETIARWQPDVVAVETVFVSANVRSAILMAHGRGAALLAASLSGVPIHEYAPREIKASVAGRGNASKHQILEMVRLLLALKTTPATDHESDAMATALAHAFRARLAPRLRDTAAKGDLSPAKQLLAQARKKSRRRR